MDMDIILKIAGALGLALVLLSMVTGTSWLIRIRIVIAMFIGIVVIGIFTWPLVQPADPFGFIGIPKLVNALIIIALAVVTALVSFFILWPNGKQIAVIVVPVGVCVWSIRCASIADTIRQTTDIDKRLGIYQSMLPQPFFWLLVIAAGILPVYLAHCLVGPKVHIHEQETLEKAKNKIANNVTALLGSALIGFFLVSLLAQGLKIPGTKFIAQPAVAQIAFAVFVAFAVAAFIVKHFINAHYFWPVAATSFVASFGLFFFTKRPVLERISIDFPANIFSHPTAAILPIQMVSFGTLGAIAGFWMVELFHQWQENELKSPNDQ